MPKPYDSGIMEFVTGDSSTEVVSALSEPMRSGDWDAVTIDLWLRALAGAKVRVGVQFSNNPFEFTDTAKEFAATYVTANGWTRGTTTYDLFAVTGATPRTWFRFVALGLNTSGSLAGGGQIRIVVAPKPLRILRRVKSGTVRVNTKGSDSSQAKTPVAEVFETAGFTVHRVVLEVVGISSTMKIQVGCEETDTPDDPTTWSTVGSLGSEVTAVGVTFPTTFSNVSFTRRYARYVISAKNDTGGTDIESAIVSILVEVRG
jgi:hypothetical protein